MSWLDGLQNWPSVTPMGGRNCMFDVNLCLLYSFEGVWCVNVIDCMHFCRLWCHDWRWKFLHNRCPHCVIRWRGFAFLCSYFWYKYINIARIHDFTLKFDQMLDPEAWSVAELLVFLWKLGCVGLFLRKKALKWELISHIYLHPSSMDKIHTQSGSIWQIISDENRHEKIFVCLGPPHLAALCRTNLGATEKNDGGK